MSQRFDTQSPIIEISIDLTNSSQVTPDQLDLTATAVKRDAMRWHLETAVADHEEAQALALENRATELEHTPTPELLERLADEYGFSWATIARAMNVTPTAVRKWRRGDEATAANHQTLARLAAFVEIAEAGHPLTNDISYWLEAPVFEKTSLTRLDLYRRGLYAELLDIISGRRTGREVLDATTPEWRATSLDNDTSSVVWNDDGTPSIVQAGD